MKRECAVAAVAALCCFAGNATAAVVLQGTAPTSATNIYNTYSAASPLDLSTFSDYVALPTFARGDNPLNGVRPTGSAFGTSITPLTATPPASPSTTNSGYRLASGTAGPGFIRPGATPVTYQGWAFNQAETYTSPTATDGLSLTYTLAANTTATLNYYIGSNNAMFEYSLTAAGQGTPLASLTTPTGMTGGTGNVTGQPGTGSNSGLLSFTVTNQDATATTLTFNLYYAGLSASGGSPGIGLSAASATVPEPAILGLAGLGVVALLRRNRSARAK